MKETIAELVRPQNLKEFVGQEHLVGEGGIISRLIKRKFLPSLLFWGPPGCGKTTLALLIGELFSYPLYHLSSVDTTAGEIKKLFMQAYKNYHTNFCPTIILIDEIHRFNRSQQVIFLPELERRKIIIIATTTENPSFRLISPLLSRLKVIQFKTLTVEEIIHIIERALEKWQVINPKSSVKLTREVIEFLANLADGDARVALNELELILRVGEGEIDLKNAQILIQTHPAHYSKDLHYQLLSAFHKSLRGSDVDASLYWLGRMLATGTDLMAILRRLIVCASEDIGLANTKALIYALAAKEVVEFVGMPEAQQALAQATVYIALSPKSNSLYRAIQSVNEAIKRFGSLPVPVHICPASTPFLKELGYGKEYLYPHNFAGSIVKQEYLPREISKLNFYVPSSEGEEKIFFRQWEKIRKFLRDSRP